MIFTNFLMAMASFVPGRTSTARHSYCSHMRHERGYGNNCEGFIDPQSYSSGCRLLALSGMRLLACLIVAPRQGYDEPGLLSYAIRSFCRTSADGVDRSQSARSNFGKSAMALRLNLHPPQNLGGAIIFRKTRNPFFGQLRGANMGANETDGERRVQQGG